MSGQYVPLNDLRNDDGNGVQAYTEVNKGCVWGLPKRWVVAGGSLLCLSIWLLFTYSKPSSSVLSSGPPYDRLSSAALLGATEDTARLWFPPVGNSFHPAVAPYNLSPKPRPRTPLFIAFTRNNAMLQQVVLSYIAAGWPREDIIIVDNSGTMDANNRGLLSRQNPFYLDYEVLRSRYGVSILQTPVLLNFAQLMNFFLRTAIAQDWRYFFWSHMDVAVLSDEATVPYQSFHQRVVRILADLRIDTLHGTGTQAASDKDWAIKYFTYDWLTLVNVAAWRKIGQWDPFIPYYASDCDAYSRIALNGFTKDDVRAGHIFDLPTEISKPEEKFFPSTSEPTLNTDRYQSLVHELEELMAKKPENNRNHWQGEGHGGQGEPWTYDPDGFQRLWWKTADFGRQLYREKWGTSECRLEDHGVTLADMFKTSG